MKIKPKPSILDTRSKLLIVFVVIVGYAITFAFIAVIPEVRITETEVIWGLSIGIIYLLVALNEHYIYKFLPPGWAETLFFTIQCFLVFGHGIVLYIGGNFLMGMPIIWFAIERLRSWQRILVYLALIAAVVVPLGLRHETWETALINGITAGIYFLFVGMFVNMQQNERRARERAENLMAELEQANLQLAAYATQAEELAMTQERNRLAREIHDNLGHYLTVVNVQIEAAKVVMGSNPERALNALDKAQELTKKGLARVRESVATLRESPIGNRTLSEAIATLVEDVKHSGVVTEFKVTGDPKILENKSALAIYRAAQEGLTNVHRHAHASRIDVQIERKGIWYIPPHLSCSVPPQYCFSWKDVGFY